MTASLLLDLWRHGWCVVKGVCDVRSLEPPTRPQRPKEKLLFPSFCHILKLRERFSYPRLFQHVKPVSIILNQRQKTFHRMAPPRRENLVFTSMLGHDSSLLGQWGADSWECDGERWDSLFRCLHQYTERTHGSVSDHFILTRIRQKSCFSMTVPGHTQVRRLGKLLLAVVGQYYIIHSVPVI